MGKDKRQEGHHQCHLLEAVQPNGRPHPEPKKASLSREELVFIQQLMNKMKMNSNAPSTSHYAQASTAGSAPTQGTIIAFHSSNFVEQPT